MFQATLFPLVIAKTDKHSDNETVQRGIKAINIIYSMTSRIPQLIEQSHLESSEGMKESHNHVK